jgi:DNA-binding NtrC family response regulator
MKHLSISRARQNWREHQKIFKVIILEDNELFNDVLTRQIEYYTTTLGMERDCLFEVHSYTSPADFIRNLRNDTDIAFVDYYLENGITGSDMVEKIRERCWDCKVVIVSQKRNLATASVHMTDETIDFVFKDNQALPKCCVILESIVDSNLILLHSSVNNPYSPRKIRVSPKTMPLPL